MQAETLQAEVRSGGGKGPARRLRNAGKIPAVFYGPGVDPTPLAVSPKELLHVLSGELGRNAVVKLAFQAGSADFAMVRELDVHPVTRAIRHVDFYRVSPDRAVTVNVPFKVTGRSLGQQKGGKVNVVVHMLPVRCTPDKIPAAIVADITEVDLNGAFAARDLRLEAGIEVLVRSGLTLVNVMEDRRAALAEAAEAAESAAAAAEKAAG